MTLKRNPFTPQDPITDPLQFAGRKKELLASIDALFNNRHLLVSGTRGIGKSSFANQLVRIAKGERTLIDKFVIDLGIFRFKYLVAEHRCTPENDLTTIAKMLIRSLESNLKTSNYVFKDTQLKPEFDLKVVKAGVDTKVATDTASELTAEFVEKIEEVWDKLSRFGVNGICILIDEIDRVKAGVDLTSFFKVASEKLRSDGYKQVSFLVVGVSGTITKFIETHPSVGRLFAPIVVPTMSVDELMEIIRQAEISTGVKFEKTVSDFIVSLSKGFPAVTHFLGYECFRANRDGLIDDDDYYKGLKDAIKIKSPEYEDKWSRAGTGKYQKILRAIAQYQGENVPLNFISNKIRMKQHEFSTNMSTLVERQILEKVERGLYRFIDPLFRIYILLQQQTNEKEMQTPDIDLSRLREQSI
jgi:hypothetical protein